MKFLRHVLVLLALAGASPALAEPLMYAPLPASKDLYSFADVYRLTVGATVPGSGMSEWPLAAPPQEGFAYQIRNVAGAPAAAAAPAYAFSIAAVTPTRPEGWLLLLSGLAAAAWVARRRLGTTIRG
jgi:hypothetical protein